MATKETRKTKRMLPLIGCGLLLLLVAALLLRGCSLLRGQTNRFGSQETTETLPANVRQAGDFSTQDGFVTYPGAVTGVDVSEHQGEIDWQAVKDSGVSFAIIRLGYRGYSSGGLNMDETFEQNIEGATQAGLDVGVYFFSQAVNSAEAEEEADYVLNAVKGYTLACPVFFDWEEISEAERTINMTSQDISDAALAFCKRIEKSGLKAGVYFNQTYGYSVMRLAELKDYSYWLAEYDESMSFYYDVQYWQYSCTGRVAGITTDVDLNLLFDGEAE